MYFKVNYTNSCIKAIFAYYFCIGLFSGLNYRINEWMVQRENESISQLMNQRMDELIDELTDEPTNGWTSWWTNWWTNGWICEWTNWWANES